MSLMVFFFFLLLQCTHSCFPLYSKWLLSVLVKKKKRGGMEGSALVQLITRNISAMVVFLSLISQATPNEWLSRPTLSFIKITWDNRVKRKTQINHGTCTFKISQEIHCLLCFPLATKWDSGQEELSHTFLANI